MTLFFYGGADGEQVLFDRIICEPKCSLDGTLREYPDRWAGWYAIPPLQIYASFPRAIGSGSRDMPPSAVPFAPASEMCPVPCSLTRLAPVLERCSLPSYDWLSLQKYAPSPHTIGSPHTSAPGRGCPQPHGQMGPCPHASLVCQFVDDPFVDDPCPFVD